MKTAFAYVRVSTQDQEKQGNSIPEQLSRIHIFADNQDIKIVQTYQDSSSAYHDEHREGFNQMIADSLNTRPNFIIVDDSSRFARTRDVASSTKKLLRKHGIELLHASEENINPRTSSGLWLEGIRELKNEAHSMDISHNVIRGMSGNVKQRDPETGWCYKNGGRPPYGYQIIHLNRGVNSKGKPIIKSIWDLHPDNAPIAKLIIVDLYTNQEMSYNKIRDYLNDNNIPAPGNKAWGTSTIVEMLRANRLEQYAGTAFWNKENRKTMGTRFNPREEWVEVPNAHPAIITEEELEMALKRHARGQTDFTISRTKNSPYLFTGKNLEGNPMFSCAACGGNVIGYRSSSRHWRKYICGQHRYKGEALCPHKFMVDVNTVEQKVLEEIITRYTTPERIDEIIKDIQKDINAGYKEYNDTLKEFNKQKSNLVLQKQRLLDAIKSGIDPLLIKDEADNLTDQINQIDIKINYLKDNPPQNINFSEDEIRNFFSNFSLVFDNATMPERKKLIRTFVRQLELDPENEEIRVSFYPDHLVHRIGVGGGT